MADYSVERDDFAGYDSYVLRAGATGAAAQIVPALGANCIAFRAPPVGTAGPLVDLLPPLSGVADIGPTGYMSGNPILFPFPSRMRQGRFTFEGQTNQFDVDPTMVTTFMGWSPRNLGRWSMPRAPTPGRPSAPASIWAPTRTSAGNTPMLVGSR